MKNNVNVIVNGGAANQTANTKGRKLTAKPSTFYLDEGIYKGTITDAYWYKNDDGQDKVMLEFKLDNGTYFRTSVPDYMIEDYPYSELISQANVSYVEDFVGLKVKFTIRHKEKDGMIYSNIKRIELDV